MNIYTFFYFSHRGCPDAAVDHTDCGPTTELTKFRICPNWLSWNEWSTCEQDEKKYEVIGGNRTENYYYTFKRTRTRECNTYDDQCMTEPGLLKSTEEAQQCGSFLIYNIYLDKYRGVAVICWGRSVDNSVLWTRRHIFILLPLT